MAQRLLDIFFYGLFMDQQLLSDKGAQASDIQLAVVPGFVLRIGARAALVPDTAGTAHGVVMKLSHSDIERLYSEPSLLVYRPEPVLATLQSGATVATLCFNLPEAPPQMSAMRNMLRNYASWHGVSVCPTPMWLPFAETAA